MLMNPEVGHAALRRGRVSSPEAVYFLTICTDGRTRGLTEPGIAPEILCQVDAAEADNVWLARCAVVMPDHLHVLVKLGAKLPLGKAVARLKAKTAASLRNV